MALCIVYLASPRTFRIGTDLRYTMLQSSLSYTRHCFPTTDIYIFHEDYTDEDKAGLPGVKEFIPVDFRGFESLRNPALTAPYGYLMMCRFFCGILQAHPALQQYTHLMRLDDDSFFMPPYPSLSPDIFAYDYIYRTGFREQRDQQSLYEFTMRFLERQMGPIRFQLRRAALLNRLTQREVIRNGRYTGAAPYNNFHITSLRLWTHPVVQAYLREMEAVRGILREGWLDANVHAMIVYVLSELVPIREYVWTSFGYRHNTHVAAVGSMRANADPSLPPFPDPIEIAPSSSEDVLVP